MKLVGYIELTFIFHKEGKKWVAYCNELGTSTFDRSLMGAQDKLKEAVECHLNTLEDLNERKRFFKENNISFYTHKPRAKTITVSAPVNKTTFVQPYIQSIPACPA